MLNYLLSAFIARENDVPTEDDIFHNKGEK